MKSLNLIVLALFATTILGFAPVQSALAVDPVMLSDTTIPLNATVDITFTNTTEEPFDTVAIAVLEVDGDVCRKVVHNIEPGFSFTLTYPNDFHPDLGSTDCATNMLGEYHVMSKAGTPPIADQTFNTSFFVIPESPIGVAALMGSSLAALAGFIGIRHYRMNKNSDFSM